MDRRLGRVAGAVIQRRYLGLMAIPALLLQCHPSSCDIPPPLVPTTSVAPGAYAFLFTDTAGRPARCPGPAPRADPVRDRRTGGHGRRAGRHRTGGGQRGCGQLPTCSSWSGLSSTGVRSPGTEAMIGYRQSFPSAGQIGEGSIEVAGGTVEVIGGTAYVLAGLAGDLRRLALIHELGHTVGLGHVADAGQVMFSTAGRRTVRSTGPAMWRGCASSAPASRASAWSADPPNLTVGSARSPGPTDGGVSRSRRGRGPGCDRRGRPAACAKIAGTSSSTARKWRCEMTYSVQSVSHTARRRPWAVVEQRQLTDDRARPERGDLAAVALHGHLALQHDEGLPAGLALVDEQRAGRHPDLVTGAGDPSRVPAPCTRRRAARCGGGRRRPSCSPWLVTDQVPGDRRHGPARPAVAQRLPWFLTASMAAAAASGSRYVPPRSSGRRSPSRS